MRSALSPVCFSTAARGCALRRSVQAGIALALFCGVVFAAETSQTAPSVAATDETTFYERLQFVAHKRMLVGLGIGDSALQSLATGAAADAIGELSQKSVAGDRNATIALVRIQHWCNRISQTRPVDAQAQLSRLATVVSPEKLARIGGVFNAERAYQERARSHCQRAPFDYQGIETRLRQAAQAGDAPSATELSQFVRDPRQRDVLLQQAVDKNYAPAVQALATQRLMAVQRGQTTENVASIRLLFKQAGRTLPRAKVDLANCMALGCDGHPADAGGAAPFGFDAAKDGEPLAFASMMRMPWSGRLTRPQMLGWQYYGDRLNETGCTGDAYVQNVLMFSQAIRMLENGLPNEQLDEAKMQAETLWKENSERAKREQGCG